MSVSTGTMTLIWGLKGFGAKEGNPSQANLLEKQYRARILLDVLDANKETVVLASVVASELLVGVPPGRHDDFLAELSKRFEVRPFDLPACALAAQLWLQHRGLPKDDQIQRQCLKSDVLIVATAKVAGASVFYTDDEKCRRLADAAGLEGKALPQSHPDMFKDAELRRGLNLPPR